MSTTLTPADLAPLTVAPKQPVGRCPRGRQILAPTIAEWDDDVDATIVRVRHARKVAR